jgi:hypothetical protein
VVYEFGIFNRVRSNLPPFLILNFVLTPMPGRLYLITASLVLLGCQALIGCQPVPRRPEVDLRPAPKPSPLPWKQGSGQVQVPKGQQPKGFQVADPTASPKATPKANSKPKSTTKANTTLSPDLAAKLADAEDKAQSAWSMQQSAQTKEDWNFVFDRWKLAIQIAKSIPGKNPQVQQKIAEFQDGLEQATQDAKISLNPS